jgi:protein gp37
MSDNTAIEWATLGLTRGATWNPIRARNKATGAKGHHCEHVSPGCANCYAERQNKRGIGTGLEYKPGNRQHVEIYLDETALLQPLRWKAPRGIFVCSMTDLFADFVTDEIRDRIFAVMALAPHRFAVLTKRSKQMREYLTNWRECLQGPMEEIIAAARAIRPDDLYCMDKWPLPNVWIGVTAEDQERADERIPDLLATPAAVRFVSVEPMLNDVDFRQIRLAMEPHCQIIDALTGYSSDTPYGYVASGLPDPFSRGRLDWIICGGESGPNARPMHPQWARDLRDQCQAAGVAYFHKQNGEFAPGEIAGAYLDPEKRAKGMTLFDGEWGEDWSEIEGYAEDEPDVYRVGLRRAGRLLDGREHNEFPH